MMKVNKAVAAWTTIGLLLIGAVAWAGGGEMTITGVISGVNPATRIRDGCQRRADCRAVRIQCRWPVQHLHRVGPTRAHVRRNCHRGLDVDAHLHGVSPGRRGRMVPRWHRQHGVQGNGSEAEVTVRHAKLSSSCLRGKRPRYDRAGRVTRSVSSDQTASTHRDFPAG